VCKDDALRIPEQDMITLFAGLAATMPIGVLSNCHEREVRCWSESPFAPLTSGFGRATRIGAMKPTPIAYEWVLRELQVAGFGAVVHCNVFDRSNGLVGPDEQRRRAGQADASVDTIDQLAAVLTDLVDPGDG
jgi:hypothetical protein